MINQSIAFHPPKINVTKPCDQLATTSIQFIGSTCTLKSLKTPVHVTKPFVFAPRSQSDWLYPWLKLKAFSIHAISRPISLEWQVKSEFYRRSKLISCTIINKDQINSTLMPRRCMTINPLMRRASLSHAPGHFSSPLLRRWAPNILFSIGN